MAQLFFKPKYVWFTVHLEGHEIPDTSGQLAELIVYISSTTVDRYSHQILLIESRYGVSIVRIWEKTDHL